MDRRPASDQVSRARTGQGRLVVVSNRLPFHTVRRRERLIMAPAPGGLVSALEGVLGHYEGVWIGWSGVERDAPAAANLRLPRGERMRYRAVPLSGHEVDLYYGEFANRTLWPLFHYFVGRTRIEGRSWRVYERVNQRFAEVAFAEAQEAQLVWVHDYQLLRVPHHLRRLRPRCAIGFFLHIPFPDVEVFRVLPWAPELLRGLLAADLVGFQVPKYATHFLACVEELLGLEVDRAAGVAHFEGRDVAVQAHPISIDVERIARMAALAPAASRDPDEPKTVLGVDRLDYTKGIPERLLAVERFFERYPAWRGRVRFTQILVPSRERVAEYRDLKRQIDEMIGRINGRLSDGGWSPIRYLVRSLPTEELVTLYRLADVALVTPLRDGMNLVAKEYVAANAGGNGVLILSELAGAAHELPEALIVNPFNIDAVAEALHDALSMPDAERRARMTALADRVRRNDVHCWTRRFLDAAREATEPRRRPRPSPADQVVRRLAPWLVQRPVLALFLDYDGTLTPIVDRPEDAVLAPEAREILAQADRAGHVETVVVSGRSLEDIRARVGLPELTYVGNHGLEIEGPGIAFRHPDAMRYEDVVARAAEALEALPVRGGRVERKGLTLSWHVRDIPPRERPLAEQSAAAVLRRAGLVVTTGIDVIEGRPPIDWHKGSAVLHVLVHRHGPAWPTRVRALYVGDDRTDEDAFRSLRGLGRSIRVGGVASVGGDRGAVLALPDPASVLQMVRRLASRALLEAAG
ncbi:MAG TPA: bifunctional alpha,alpha-trehalose-phosphate synthase (UDP-forming)/trehalose-phosphatase [Gemmatimonadales bacterium]|nr:bifunctional alpha,alpha-trehalose-phosphate synthase (UDP-forming)/trehalose-phosphatase [Gemmatimonadales bacterium]